MGWKAVAGLTGSALVGALVLGYHPFAEDGGLYLAEIKRGLDKSLYTRGTEFVSGHLGGLPGFTDAVAWLVRSAGWRLDWVMIAIQFSCLCAVLSGSWLLAARCYRKREARWGAVGTVALCGGMPIAGTSLMLIDPYVTARSVAFALTVLGLAGLASFMLDGRWWTLCGALMAVSLAVLAHPLMGMYGIGSAAVLGCLLSRRRGVQVCGVLGAFVVAGLSAVVVQATAAAETDAYRRVAATRYYWFLSEWHWYELIGIAAPLIILGCLGWQRGGAERGFEWMGVTVGGVAVAVAVCLARKGSATYAVARLQPLRSFQMVYFILLIVLGAWVGDRVLRRSVQRWGVAALVIGCSMAYVQRQTYPASAHVEFPGSRSPNRWEEAFQWVRANTPKDALFGLDADYVHRAGEDTQGFRAVAERSALPDYSKDGGQAAIRPELTGAWMSGQAAQAGLTEESDAMRVAKLRPLGVTWVVMGREAKTNFVCPFANDLVMVCRMGQ